MSEKWKSCCVLKKGDNFGQRAILKENRRTLDVITKTDYTVLFQSNFLKHNYELIIKKVYILFFLIYHFKIQNI